MFRTNNNKDRVDYSEMLLPPEGYVLEFAVGTTFSLDLEALTAVCIALGLREELDSGLLQNPISMLNALQKVSDKVLIFCDAGRIKVPGAPSSLLVLLEKMIIPVGLTGRRNSNDFPAFHPKTWLLQYRNAEGEYAYRFAVMSRNLTFDRSWDMSIAIDSSKSVRQRKKTRPIIDFVGYLREKITNKTQDFRRKRSILKSLMERLETVSFSLDSREFEEDFTIMPLGIGPAGYDITKEPIQCQKPYTKDYSFHELVVFSPFLTSSIVEYWNRPEHNLKDTTRTLITRRSELEKLTAEQVSSFRIFVLKEKVVEGEEYISDDSDDKQLQDIHAKIILRQKYGHTDLYIGSMNATYGAMYQNVEMVIRIGTKYRFMNGEKFLEEIFCGPDDGKENPFEEVTIERTEAIHEEDEKDALERIIDIVCRMHMHAQVVENGENADKYDVRITVDEDLSPKRFAFLNRAKKAQQPEQGAGMKGAADRLQTGSAEFPEGTVQIFLSPVRRNTFIPLDKEIQFFGMDTLQLTEFYQLRVKGAAAELTRVLMIPTKGFPDNRESAVVNSVVKDRRSFVEYVAFILGEDYLMSALEESSLTGSGFWGTQKDQMPALYEKMLKTALNERERLKEIDYLLKMVEDKEVIPDEFRDLYDIFRTTLKLK